MATCGHSNEDPTAKIKEKWARVVGSWSTYRAGRGCIMTIQSIFNELDGLDILR